MRLADLVINCLRETFHNDDSNLTVALLRDGSLFKNPEYSNQVNNILLSINKAISRLMTSEKIELKYAVLTADKDEDVYDVSSITDLRKIRTVFILKNGSPYWIGWSQVGEKLLYLGYGLDSTIHVGYERKIPNFTEADFESEDDIETKYGLTDELCNYINYFAKSELWEEVDPDRCKRYLNYFEQFVAEVNKRQSIPYQNSIRAKYRI
ncbi:MAG: hypothetical protein PHX79_05725 [Sphaerochaetaceae bacterium]|nr:hypothetical protein [Sphaerochaetaceae bacterium]